MNENVHQATTSLLDGERTTRNLDHQQSLTDAGWSLADRIELTGAYDSLSWGNLRTLWAARREKKMGQHDPDIAAGRMRRAWHEGMDPPEQFTLTKPLGEPTRVLVLGDTGDGSEAQMAVARQVEGRARDGKRPDVATLLIQSDIVYPAGAGNEYDRKFFRVYEEIHAMGVPIYAVPGNHDWDDGALAAFMAVFCGRVEVPNEVYTARDGALTPLQRRLWTPKPGPVSPGWCPAGAKPRQTHPYLALDVGGVLYIGIDTGFGSCIDRAQARWLVDIVEAPDNADKPKILFTGKPLIVNGQRNPCPVAHDPTTGEEAIAGRDRCYRFVDDIVREPRNGFVAVLGGDVHNYQRYRTRIETHAGEHLDMPYIVCGGGGVFIGQTYWLPKIDLTAEVSGDHISCAENETVLFPTRAHSYLFWDKLVRQSRRYAPFGMSLTLSVAALASALLAVVLTAWNWVTSNSLPVTTPSIRASLLLLVVAIAANTSARPITARARFFALAAAAAPAATVFWWMGSDRTLHLHLVTPGNTWGRYLIAGGIFGGVLLLQAADWSRLGRGGLRKVRGTIAIFACLFLGGASIGLLATSFGPAVNATWADVAAAGIACVALAVIAWLTHLGSGRLHVNQTFENLAAELSGSKTSVTRSVKRARRVGEHQKLFSIFETFNDGRLENTVFKPLAGDVKSYLPLYRSFLEIESSREQDEWKLEFRAYAVTGEKTSDTRGTTRPVLVDGFVVRWAPHGVVRMEA